MTQDEVKETSSPRRKAGRGLRIVKWSVVVIAAALVCVGGWRYYRHTKQFPSTDDAYLRADVVRVSAQVTGSVAAVPVNDQQDVAANQLLFRLDPKPFRYRLRKARAGLELARQEVAADGAAVAAAQAAVRDRQAKLRKAQQDYRRVHDLVRRNMESQSQLDDARAARDSAVADVRLAQAQLNEARVRLGSTGEQNNRIQQAKAALDQARLDLAHTRVYASCKGRISGLQMQPGDTVKADDPEFALVCESRFWVYANYKETDLSRIRPGQVATVSVDNYPNHTFHGIVESVNPASGAAFSLLPPENASGNWVKVTQRVPVRILLVDAGPRYPLRVQTSTEVSIATGTGRVPKGRSLGTTLNDAQALALAASDGLAVARSGTTSSAARVDPPRASGATDGSSAAAGGRPSNH